MGKHILLIEDDKAIQESLLWVFKSEGYNVIVANHGKEALQYLISSDLPGLILLDMAMPVMNGFEFRLKQQQDQRIANIPVYIMSADKQILSQIHKKQNEEFMHKPLDLDLLLKAVNRYCEL